MPNLYQLQDDSFVLTDDLISKRQLMAMTGVCRATIQIWQRKGMPYTRFKNNRNAYNPADVDRWLADQGYPTIEEQRKLRKG